MAAILKLRRGTSFTSLQEAEFFYDKGLEALVIGDGSGSNTGHKTLVKLTELNSGSIYLNGDITGSHISASGNISASNLILSGDAEIIGNITLGGDIFLGDGTNATDNINVNASFSGSLIPTTTDVFTLGSNTKKYLDLRVVNATIDNINLPGSNILSSSVTDFTDYSQSVDNRLDLEESKSLTLQTVTSSLDNRLDVEESKSLTLTTLTASYDNRLSNLQITSASHDSRLVNIESTTSSLDNRVTQLETDTGSQDQRLDRIELETSSLDTRLDVEETKSATLETVTSSLDNRLDLEESKSLTLQTVTSSFDNRLDNLELDSSSQDGRLDNIESYTSSFATDTVTLTNKTINGSNNTLTVDISRDTNLAVSDTTEVNMILTDDTISAELIGGVVSGSSQINADTVTNFDSNVKTKLDDETVISGSSQVDYSSISGINNNIISASSDTSQVDMIINGGSISANLKGGVVSGSIQILGGSNILSSSNENFNGFSSSVDSRLDTIEGPLSTSLDSRLDSLETDTHTHSNKAQLDTINQNLATTSDVTFNTGSFTGDMTVTGNLTVLGSATEISSTELKIEDKLITVASGSSDSAAADGAGIEIDGANKSLKWDHNTSQFVLDAKVSSSVGFKGEGGELTGIDTDQVTEGSNLYYTDTRVKSKIDSDGVISGSIQLHTDLDARYLEINGDDVVSGSAQIDADQTTGWVVDVRKQIDNIGLISGSVQVNANTITNFDSNVKTKLDDENVHSGSFLGTASTTNLGEGSNLYYTDVRVKTKLSGETVHSGSFLGTASTQNLTEHSSNLYYTDTRVKAKLDTETVVSGSSQISINNTSGNLTTLGTITSGDVKAILPGGTVSGSSQIDYSSLSGINNDIVSASTDSGRVNFTITDGNISADLIGGVVSGSSQISSDQTNGWVVDVRKQIDNVGLISGSSQVNANTITNFDSNVKAKLDAETVVSGSTFSSPSQGTVRATINGVNTDVDTGLQQADSPTFNTLTLSSVVAGGSSDFDALFNVSGLLKKRTIGTAAFLNVSASIADDPNSIPTTKAVNDALVAAGAGDITAVNSTTTISPSTTGLIHTEEGTSDSGAYGNTGNIVIAIATGSSHFVNAVQGISPSLPSGVVSGSSQLYSDLDSRYNNELGEGVVSGSSQVVLNDADKTGFDTADVSEGTNLYYTDTRVKTKLDADGVISGSSQVNANTIINFDSNVKTKLDAETVISSSAQITALGFSTNDNELTTEEVQDIVGGMVSGNTESGISVTYDDVGNSLDFSVTSQTDENFTTADHSKLDNIEASADVTDTTNVTAAGALMDSEVTNLSQVKAFDSSDYLASSVTTISSAQGTKLGHISVTQAVDLDTIESNTSTNNDKVGYTDSLVKTKLDAETVISGSSQVQIASVTGFSAVSTSLDDRLDTLEGDVHENVLTFGDTSTINLSRSTNTITANVIGGVVSGSSQININHLDTSDLSEHSSNLYYTDTRVKTKLDAETVISGSSQVSLGGDVTGTANDVNVAKVQGVALTSGEATQLATIGTTTISATQWGYLGGSDQNVKTNSNVSFASASLSNVTISGNLKVLGDSVEIAVSDLKIEDKLITVASGSSDSAAADGAGIEIAGANESITWNHANTRFNFSDDIHVTGTIKSSDDIIAFASSDKELKNNIQPIQNSLEKINKISGNSFDWNEDKQDIYKGKDYGVIAQEIEEVLPELVITRENGYKAVKYDKLVSLLIEGIKDLSKEVEELKRKIDNQ